ncbi:hypothetical protein BKK51_12275 [Rodentibacter trehalosifermentans]|uniref:DUF2612 domain-containing protein n=2 Tax=Rodentibacter trehalosifermentans TaxID=1908263 RepID=A0A1V3ILN4_9PAST|nr:DUF2612 domain-containing protein [Rodentibacter trehalosifermentans]OOF42923.1 hypothetical protein BKK51_12275 [Rodentibacter trehalosifermentans]
MKNVKATIISQYANSPVLCNLIERFDEYIDPKYDIDHFYRLIWNIDTAEGIGLDFWGKVVGIQRDIVINEKNQFIGSTLAADDLEKYKINSRYFMNDEMFRKMILMKAMSNIIYTTAYNINTLLLLLFEKRGRAYFVKSGTMSARYIFEFNLTPDEKAVLISTDLLPRPTGVLVDFYEPDIKKTFGFIEANMAPFGEGAFYIGDR